MFQDKLEFTVSPLLKISLSFRGRVTVVGGDSATGKTLIAEVCRKRAEYDKVYKRKSIFSSMSFYNVASDLAGILDEENRFIIIDNADYLFEGNADLVDVINGDCSNQYMIFARCAMGLVVPPTQIAELSESNNTLTLRYLR